MNLEPGELEDLRSRLGREPSDTEARIVAAEWSEHCSYKSSREHLSILPRTGPGVVGGPGLDSGALDVGDGWVVTAHIESHNHPSAVEPYGGAATGVGGVIRDILSAGTRPIAILDGLRFGDPSGGHARWLFRSAVSGIADYGNCIGVPTIGGEVEFDASYDGYALVDVAAIGFGRRSSLIRNRASAGDAVLLLGGPTGRDGIGGSQFASESLDAQDRSAVQIPDPFAEKMLIEAVIEARRAGLIRAMKDLGGGGLSCAISETADALGVGIEADVSRVHLRGELEPWEVMVSESQERMLLLAAPGDVPRIESICGRLGVACSQIGRASDGGQMVIRRGDEVISDMPARVVANAPPQEHAASPPGPAPDPGSRPRADHSAALLRMLGSPNMSSRAWVYGQYDHEVGIRTVVRPGMDASALRLDNGRYLAVSMDAAPKHCNIDPRAGAAGCLEEACRNVVCAGARPAAMLDHLQFGDPRDGRVFWSFKESVAGMAWYARSAGIPCIGGKVSLYNETPSGPIKPTPVALVLGLADRPFRQGSAADGDALFVIGATREEMGGSEYMEQVHGTAEGACPAVDPGETAANMDAVLALQGAGLARAVHDCSKGGIAAALAELCIAGRTGCRAEPGSFPGDVPEDAALFSESHSRYLVVCPGSRADAAEAELRRRGVRHSRAGVFGGGAIRAGGVDLSVDKARAAWLGALGGLVHG